jgi:sn-glycerol 3-phosphate transport system substrate-binding protein
MTRFLPLLLILFSSFSFAQELVLRHKLEGRALDALATRVVQFNDELKGKGRIRLQEVPAVEDRHELPTMALLDISDSMEFFGTQPRFKSLSAVMREAGEKFHERQLFPQIVDAADDGNGKLQALPMAMALPVLYLNRDLLRKAGVDPEQAPKTWWELQEVAGKLYDSGVACPLTSSAFSWVHLENLASQHGQAIAQRQKTAEKVMINSLVNVKHLALLASWQKSRYFHYSGSGHQGDARFLSGECAMLTGASSLYAEGLRQGLDIAVLPLPFYDDVYGSKQSDILPDGASLWILAGLKKPENKLAARFVSFLLRPNIQREWVKATSFLPMSPGAIDALRQPQTFPAALLDAAQRRLSAPTKNSTRPKLGVAREKLRAIFGEEVQLVWNTDRPAKEALDLTVQRANQLGAPLIKPR